MSIVPENPIDVSILYVAHGAPKHANLANSYDKFSEGS